MLIKIPQGWEIPEREATPEATYLNRRQLLAGLGLAGMGGQLIATAATTAAVRQNTEFNTGDRPVTEEWAATGYNNYYEFDAENKENVKNLVGKFNVSPWSVKVSGLVNKPQTFDLDKLVSSVQLEERVCRFRCVEAWAMTVPWSGFPMSALIKMVEPKPEAKFIKFWSVVRPDEMPGVRASRGYHFPYYEGLRMDEAMHPLAFFATGMYGKPIPKQNGAPIRAVLPWKYGYKGAKSIERIEFVAKEPATFWNDLNSGEYGFYSNVNPGKPHPRWSQATEKVLPKMSRQPTLMYNGYEKWVAGLYNGKES